MNNTQQLLRQRRGPHDKNSDNIYVLKPLALNNHESLRAFLSARGTLSHVRMSGSSRPRWNKKAKGTSPIKLLSAARKARPSQCRTAGLGNALPIRAR